MDLREHLYLDWSKQDRARLRDIALKVYTVLGIACAAALLFVAIEARAVEIPVHVLEKDGVTVRLMGTPCVDPKSIAQINPAFLPQFKAIDSVWPEKDGSRKRYAGCWAEIKAGEYGALEDTFVLVFEDNTSGMVSKSEFKKVRGQRGA